MNKSRNLSYIQNGCTTLSDQVQKLQSIRKTHQLDDYPILMNNNNIKLKTNRSRSIAEIGANLECSKIPRLRNERSRRHYHINENMVAYDQVNCPAKVRCIYLQKLNNFPPKAVLSLSLFLPTSFLPTLFECK